MKGLLILGMHRSGTSALAGQCASLGLWFGENLLPAQLDNPKGYYEDLGFMSANDLLVTLLFSGWDSPVSWADAVSMYPIDHPRLSAVLDSSSNVLDTLNKSGRPWAVKDPRLSRLLPLWWPVVQSMGVDVGILMAIRRPTEVAASLQQRDDLGPTTSRMLWMRYVAEPLAYALDHNLQIGIVPYDVLLQSPERLRDILHRMGFPLQSAGIPFVDNTMRHHRHEAQPETDALSAACEQLYRIAVALPVFSRDTVSRTDADIVRAGRDMSLQPYLQDIYFELMGLSESVDGGKTGSKLAVRRWTQAETIAKLRVEKQRLRTRVEALKKQLEKRTSQLNKYVEMAAKSQRSASHANTRTQASGAADAAVSGEKKRIVVHYHIYKAGGSTIVDGLRRHFGHESLIEVDKDPRYAQEKAYNTGFFERLAELHPTTVAYSAHRVVPDIHFSTKIDVFPITFIRHPLLRAISLYRFERIRKDDWPRKEIARKYDFAGWIEWCLQSEQIEALNYQSCLLSLNDKGQFISDPKSKVRRGDLALVYQRLDAIPVVGVVELFGRSLEAINLAGQALFPGLDIAEHQVNSTKIVDDWQVELNSVEKLLPAELLSRFYEANEDDLALFERYRARFATPHAKRFGGDGLPPRGSTLQGLTTKVGACVIVQEKDDYCTLKSAPWMNALVKGRNALDGYSRGWGLQFGNVAEKVRADPIYRDAMKLAKGRTIQAELCRMNLFLIVRFYLPKLARGDIIEFGSYRGGSAIFLAAVAKAVGLDSHVWALDTYEGMPATDLKIDLHRKGDFKDVDYAELVEFARQNELNNLTFVRGLFEKTMPDLIEKTKPMALAHIDCDIYSAVSYSYESVKDHMVNGGYIAFDDAHYSSCLGATEAVEDLVIRRDGKNCEQIFPHFVFRQWNNE